LRCGKRQSKRDRRTRVVHEKREADDGADRDFYTVMVMIGAGEKPTARAIEAVRSIVGHVRDLGAGDRVLPHNAFKRKTCPGVELTQLADALDRTPLAKPASEVEVGLKQWNNAFIGSADAGNYSAAVELWQRGLLASGFDPGPLDGLVGSKTRRAHSEYAEAMGELPGDRPSDALWSLLIDNMTGGQADIRTITRRARRRAKG